jgi:hypothetical protein
MIPPNEDKLGPRAASNPQKEHTMTVIVQQGTWSHRVPPTGLQSKQPTLETCEEATQQGTGHLGSLWG